KSVNITNDGTGEASILGAASTGVAVWIHAGRGDVVSLRGLIIDGQGFGAIGIGFLGGSALHVQNCVIGNFEDGIGVPDVIIRQFQNVLGGSGIVFGPELPNSQLFVSDTAIFNNGSTAQSGGILVQPEITSAADVVLDRVHLENNVRGLWVDGTDS